MSDDSVTVTNQSNPFSLGGGGVNFETRVQAAYAVLMLTESVAPCLPAWPIQRIKLQGKYAGFSTDDFVVLVEDPESKTEVKLLAQIKHDVSITENDKVFSDVIVAAWHDFNAPEVFTEGLDAIALITGPLSSMDINHVRPLLEWARHCETAQEFISKVNTPKLSSKTKQNKLNAFRIQLKTANGGADVTDEMLWRFLKCFYVIGYDLDSASGSVLSLLYSLLSQNTDDADIEGLWAGIVLAVQDANQNAGTLSLSTIPPNILANFSLSKRKVVKKDILRLSEHGKVILENIQTHIAGVHIDRNTLLLELLNESESSDFILITGSRGNGKSGIVRELATHLEKRFPVFCLRTEDFNKPHLDNVFTSIGLKGSLCELSSYFALMPKKYLLIESIEKLLELDHRNAFDDLLNFIRLSGGWTIIASGREYAFQQITFSFLNPKRVKWTSLSVSEFDDYEVETLLDKIPGIQSLGNNPEIRKLIHNPFMADFAVRVVEAGAQFSASDGEAAFRAAVWRNVIANEDYRKDGMPTRRKQTFVDVSVNRAKAMVYGVPENRFDAAALLKLEEDHLIRRDSANGLVSPAHDILEDWALAEFIETQFKAHELDINEFVESIGFQPAMNRAFRLWLHQKLRCEPESEYVVTFVMNVIKSQIPYWRDEAITAVLLGDNPYNFLCRLRTQLFENDGELLKRFCFILRISCKATDTSNVKQIASDDVTSEIAEGLWMLPYGNGWEALVLFLFENHDRIARNMIPHLTPVLEEWVVKVNVNETPANPAREVGLLSLYLLEFVKNDYRREENIKKILGVIIKVVSVIIPEFQALLERDVLDVTPRSRRDTPGYIFQLLPMVLISFESMFLCKYCPEILIKLARHVWLKADKFSDRYHPDVEECFGLNEHSEGAEFFPASGAKGPFRHLLTCHPRLALDFILELCNCTAERYVHSDLDSSDKESILPTHYPQGVATVEILLSDGSAVTQYCSHRLWCGYRGTSVLPCLLQSALMALENWLVLMAEAPDNDSTLEWVFDYVLRNSNSVMPTAVLASLATGFPEIFGKAALPLLRTPALYEWDLIRSAQEASALGVGYSSRDPFWKIYSEERNTANKRPWRGEHLESLAIRLQFTELRAEIFPIIDEFKANIPGLCETKGDDAWRYRLHRMDVRGWGVQEDQENSRLLLGPQELESDLKEKQQEFQKDQTIRDRFIRVFLWGEKTFNRERTETNYFPDWREALKETKELLAILKSGEVDEFLRMQSGGIVKACAVFLRDHATDLNEENLDLCTGILIDVGLANARSDNQQIIYDKTGLDGSVAAGNVLPLLYDYVEKDDHSTFLGMIATALTHSNDAVRCAVAAGVREYLWHRAPDIAQALIDFALEYARLKNIEISQRRRRHSSHESGHDETQPPALPANWQDIFIQDVMNGTISTKNDMSWETHNSWYLLPPLLMVPDCSTRQEHVSLFTKMICMLSEAEESERNRHSSNERIKMPDNLETEFSKRFADYLLTLGDADAQVYVDLLNQKCNSAPDFIHWLLVCILATADKQKKLEQYWSFWNKLSDSIQAIAIELSKDNYDSNRHDYRIMLLRGLFLSDTAWDVAKPEEYLFEYGLEPIYRFADSAGVNPIIFESMCRFLFYLPNVFMPKGLGILLKHQSIVGGTQLFSCVNTVYYLERVLQRLLIRDQGQSSFTAKNRDSVLGLLSAMMDTGSSTAYFLRERLLQMKI